MRKNYYVTPRADLLVLRTELGFAVSSDFDLVQGEEDNEFA